MKKETTRVFFVVDRVEDNEEIFETLQEAEEWRDKLKKEHRPRIFIAMVRNSFQDTERGWNYDDYSNEPKHCNWFGEFHFDNTVGGKG